MELEEEKNLTIQKRNTNAAFQKTKRDVLATIDVSLQQLKNDRATIKALIAEPGKIEMTLASEMKKEKELAKTVETDASEEKEVPKFKQCSYIFYASDTFAIVDALGTVWQNYVSLFQMF